MKESGGSGAGGGGGGGGGGVIANDVLTVISRFISCYSPSMQVKYQS